ncbi:MAG: hypothetical protein OCC46_01930 [Pseudodesulfovibrio sp.]
MTSSQLGCFSEDQVCQLLKGYESVGVGFKILVDNFADIQMDGVAKEYLDNGVFRRIYTLKRCIDNVYRICPPDSSAIPSHDNVTDVSIYLQSYYINLYGAFENMARICIEIFGANLAEKRKARASFLSSNVSDKVLKKLPKKLREHFNNEDFSSWQATLESFRHSLAHRIPLYVPRYSVSEEDKDTYNELDRKQFEAVIKSNFDEADAIETEKLNIVQFVPMTTHSFGESAPGLFFHAQIIADWNTLVDFFCAFLDEVANPIGDRIRKLHDVKGLKLKG